MQCTDRRHTRSPALVVESMCHLYGTHITPAAQWHILRHTGTLPSMALIGTCITRLYDVRDGLVVCEES